jgi:uncharacterized protein Yka (UPF0111/DUF47 family)
MAFTLFPREEKFFLMFEKQADMILRGGIMLNKAMQENQYDESLVNKLFALSKECDDLTLSIIQKNQDTFITPFDREDIQQFANAADDIVDSILNLARSARLLKVKKKKQELSRLGDIIEKSVTRIAEIVKLLKNKKQATSILKSCHKVKRFKNEGELVLDEIMPELLNDNDIGDIFRWKEIMDKSRELLRNNEKYILIIETMLIKMV